MKQLQQFQPFKRKRSACIIHISLWEGVLGLTCLGLALVCVWVCGCMQVVERVKHDYGDAYHTAHLEVPGEMFALAMDAQVRVQEKSPCPFISCGRFMRELKSPEVSCQGVWLLRGP